MFSGRPMKTFSDGRFAAEEDVRDLPLEELRVLLAMAERPDFCLDMGSTPDAQLGYAMTLRDAIRPAMVGSAA